MINSSNISNNFKYNIQSYNADSRIKQKNPLLNNAPVSNPVSAYSADNIKAYAPSFSAALNSRIDKKKYNAVSKKLDAQGKNQLNALLKSGKLLDANSNDKSTILDNLYKIVSEPRIKGLNDKNILKETVNALSNPFTITQNFGDVPNNIAQQIITADNTKKLTPEDLNVRSSSCVATSIEFNMASKQPAEFARMAAGLSSEQYSVTKTLKLSDISPNTIDAIWMLNEFNMNYKLKNWDEVEVTLQPDRNAIIRARIQNSYKDPGERSLVDVLMQSTFMNIGSQNTYDTLTDTRTGKYNPDNRGLTDIEKNFAEEIAEGKPKVSVTYQILDQNGRLSGYECDFNTIKTHILDALKANNNVIIGYTQMDEQNIVVNGHEITIIGAEQAPDGKLTFICNDTDDNLSEPIKWAADELIPLIHHAGLPKEVLGKDVQFTESWKEVLEIFKQMKEMPAQNIQAA